MLIKPDGDELEFAIKFDDKESNNEAKYEAFPQGLILTERAGVRHVTIHSDSQLVIQQLLGTYEANEPNMEEAYVEIVKIR